MQKTLSLKDHTILVTGAAGFIGSNIVKSLVESGARRIIALDNLSTGNLNNIKTFIDKKEIEFVNGDITVYDTCLNVTKGVDIILHQAALGSVPRSIENPVATHNTNVNGFINILEAARQNKVKRIVYASSSSVYGDNADLPKVEDKTGRPLSPYAVSKKTNELYAQVYANLYQMEIIGLRYFNVFGPMQNPHGPYAAVIPIFINNILNNKPCHIFGDGNNQRDFTYVDNVVQANLLAASTQNNKALGQVFNIAFGATKSVNALFAQIRDGLDNDAQANYLPPRPGEIKDSFASIEKAKELLGYNPQIGLDKGISLTINWYSNRFQK
jgi:UDP-N-acetylglucosamine 4-epimerase